MCIYGPEGLSLRWSPVTNGAISLPCRGFQGLFFYLRHAQGFYFSYKMLYTKNMDKINYDDFQKLDIRIGTILEAEKVEGADKLLKLVVDLGNPAGTGQVEKRTLIAGIAEDYKPEDIIGKQIPILTNLEPKIIKGIESKGMILAVDIDGKATLLHPDKKVANGSKIR